MGLFNNKGDKEVSYMKPEPRKENCELSKIELTEKEGKFSLDFTFTDSNGSVLNHKEFEPSRTINNNEISEEDYLKNAQNAASKVGHILRRFVDPKAVEAIDAENWEDYCRKAIAVLGTSYRGVKCALKVIYTEKKGKDGKNQWFATLPKYPPFISTEKAYIEFKDGGKYDVYTIPGVSADKNNDGEVSKPTVADF